MIPNVFAVEVGEKAPDFELPSTQGGKLKLSSFQGKKNVLIEFYVLDFTPTWIKELSSSRDDYAKFQEVDTEVIGISANVAFSQKAFADFLKLTFPLASDYPDLQTIDAYGVLDRERRLAQRSYFIVDKQGVIRYKNVLGRGQPLVANDALVAEIKKIQ
jgi:mycoredoxin-dependent peroxiredoxin